MDQVAGQIDEMLVNLSCDWYHPEYGLSRVTDNVLPEGQLALPIRHHFPVNTIRNRLMKKLATQVEKCRTQKVTAFGMFKADFFTNPIDFEEHQWLMLWPEPTEILPNLSSERLHLHLICRYLDILSKRGHTPEQALKSFH